MINLKKIDWLSLLALNNAVRLHGDAIALYKDGRYPSSFLLSVLSQEEIGKAHLASDFVWHSRIDGRYTPAEEEKFLGLLYRHPFKQGAFLRHSNKGIFLLKTKKGRKIYQDMFNGVLELEKQKSAYVGMKRKGGKIDLKGPILNPYQISRKKAEKQISMVHDYFVDSCVGIIAGQYEFDISDIKRVMNRRFYKELKKEWPISKDNKKWIKNVEKFLKENHMKAL